VANLKEWQGLFSEAKQSTGSPKSDRKSGQTATLGIHLSQGRVFVAMKAENEAAFKIAKPKGFPSAILVRRRNDDRNSGQTDTFVFGDQLAIAPGIRDLLCYPYSFDSAPQACLPYTEQALLEKLFGWVASEAIPEGSTIGNVAVVTPIKLPQDMEERIKAALVRGFKLDVKHIRVHFMNESVASLAYLVHGEKKKPKAGERIVALHYGSSHSQVVAGILSENNTPTFVYDGDVKAGSRTFENCIEQELDHRTGVTEEANAAKDKVRAIEKEGKQLADDRRELEEGHKRELEEGQKRIKLEASREVAEEKRKLEAERENLEQERQDQAKARLELDGMKEALKNERQKWSEERQQLVSAKELEWEVCRGPHDWLCSLGL
jgi:hypothetical protein